jgi:hypothetical protein
MSNDRVIKAIGRIERALSRLEGLPAPNPGALEALQDKYSKLRDETGSVLVELDGLIGQMKEDSRG